MTRRVHLQLAAVVSSDGTRCAAECPNVRVMPSADDITWACDRFGGVAYGVLADGSMMRRPACIAAEQAAASVPSCEAWMPALRDRVQVTGCDIVGAGTIVAIGTEGSALGMHRVRFDDTGVVVSRIPRDRLVRLVEVPASAQSGHLDGGARALDASEALREAPHAWTRGDRVRSSFSGRTGTLLDPPDSDGEAFVKWDVRSTIAGDGVYAPASDLTRIPHEPTSSAVTFSLPAATSLDLPRDRMAAMLLSEVASAEALREARVQGMREAWSIALRWIDGDCGSEASTQFEDAIEAVRKGER